MVWKAMNIHRNFQSQHTQHIFVPQGLPTLTALGATNVADS